ncbi:MAG: FlgD immunoglobulin-like domain containing protein, partial [candidate division WOR-3 bacterium]
ITLAPWHPIWGDLYWLPNPTYHHVYANVYMTVDYDRDNDTKEKDFIVKSRSHDLQMNLTGLLRVKELAPDTITTGISYNTFSVVSNSPFGPTTQFRAWFKVIRMSTNTTVYSRYLDKTIAPASYMCLFYQSGWVPTDEGLYKVISWIETRPGYNLVAQNDTIVKYYYARRPTENIQGDINSLPISFSINQNYPNPFSVMTQIKWQIPVASKVRINVYDATGRIVKTLVNKTCEAGYYHTTWDRTDERGNKVAAGIYFYEIQANDYNAKRKMVITQ